MTQKEELLTEVAKKVKKLLALSTSSNLNEANLAAEKARELLEKYNMTLTDAEIKTAEMIKDTFKVKHNSKQFPNWYFKNFPKWFLRLTNTMNQYFYVRVIYDYDGYINFIGAKTDVEVAKYVMQYLVHEIERLAEEFLKEHRGSGISIMKDLRQSFCYGAVSGLRDKLDDERQKEKLKAPIVTASGTDLMVIKSQALEEYKKKQFPTLSRLKSSATAGRNSDAYSQGHKEGKNISIRTGVGGKGQLSIGHK